MHEDEQCYEDDLRVVRGNSFLVGLLESYLLLFHNNHSIISRSYPAVNTLKASISNIVGILYSEDTCPEKMFQILFLTVLSECRTVVEEPEIEQVLVNCLSVLESHLYRSTYTILFQQHKLELVFALFMYSTTNQH